MDILNKQKKLIKIIFLLSYLIYCAALTAVYFWAGAAVIPLAFIIFIIECTLSYELRQQLRELNDLIDWQARGF